MSPFAAPLTRLDRRLVAAFLVAAGLVLLTGPCETFSAREATDLREATDTIVEQCGGPRPSRDRVEDAVGVIAAAARRDPDQPLPLRGGARATEPGALLAAVGAYLAGDRIALTAYTFTADAGPLPGPGACTHLTRARSLAERGG